MMCLIQYRWICNSSDCHSRLRLVNKNELMINHIANQGCI